MVKAIWNGKTIAESKEVLEIDGEVYFPLSSLKPTYFKNSNTQSFCSKKGLANYLHIIVDETVNEDAAWYYPKASELAFMLKGKVAFWKGVEIRKEEKQSLVPLPEFLHHLF